METSYIKENTLNTLYTNYLCNWAKHKIVISKKELKFGKGRVLLTHTDIKQLYYYSIGLLCNDVARVQNFFFNAKW